MTRDFTLNLKNPAQLLQTKLKTKKSKLGATLQFENALYSI